MTEALLVLPWLCNFWFHLIGSGVFNIAGQSGLSIDVHILSTSIKHDRSDSFPFDYEPHGIPFGL